MRRGLLPALVVVVLGVGLAACGDDDGAVGEPVPPSSTTTVDPSTLPPARPLELEPLYGDALAAVGMRLTDRGGTIDRSGGGYVASPTGTHLALYVEPVDDGRTLEEYYEGIRDVALVFADVFERWPGLETYDVCQEPIDPDGTQGPEPRPVTQIELTRAEAEAIDWGTVTVEDLVQGSRADPPDLTLRVSAEMAAHPPYAALVADDASNRPTGY